MPDTLVVNLGKGKRLRRLKCWFEILTNLLIFQGLEVVTGGVARATCHRVLSPDPAYGPRYSIPYFQMISQQVYLDKMRVYEEGKPLPAEVQRLMDTRGPARTTDGELITGQCHEATPLTACISVAVNYSEYGHDISGVAALIGRIKFVLPNAPQYVPTDR